MTGSTSLRLVLASGTAFAALCALPGAAFAQTTRQRSDHAPAATPTGAATPADDQGDRPAGKDIIVTGSRIKQDPNNSALPLHDHHQQGPEPRRHQQPRAADLVPRQQRQRRGQSGVELRRRHRRARGTNGLSAANLRGQGSAVDAGPAQRPPRRRARPPGLGGRRQPDPVRRDRPDRSAQGRRVGDLRHRRDRRRDQLHHQDQFHRHRRRRVHRHHPRQATRRSIACRARSATASSTSRASTSWPSVSKSWNKALFGRDRDFVNGNQPNRGLSIDTRGTPIATAFPINPTGATASASRQGGTLLGGTTARPRSTGPASSSPARRRWRPAASIRCACPAAPAAIRSMAA